VGCSGKEGRKLWGGVVQSWSPERDLTKVRDPGVKRVGGDLKGVGIRSSKVGDKSR